MDLPDIYITTKYVNTNMVVKTFNAPSRSDWELYFGSIKKTNLFFQKKNPHVELMTSSGYMRFNIVSEVLLIIPGMLIDNSDLQIVQKYIPIIKQLASRLKSM